jgi:hypothetical protein
MALKRHDAREHLGQPAYYICHIYGCNKKFLRGYLLTKHLKSEHNFILAPGHSRFIYKQDDDGFYRLQTKRVESLKKVNTEQAIQCKTNPKVAFEIESIVNFENGVNITVKQKKSTVTNAASSTPVAAASAETNVLTPQNKTEKVQKDISEFAIVKSYSKLIKQL